MCEIVGRHSFDDRSAQPASAVCRHGEADCGTRWRFANERSLSERLYTRPGDRFRFPPNPGSRPARKKLPRAHGKSVAAKNATRPISLHIDHLFPPGTLKHLEIRRGVWDFGEGLGAVAFEANTVDPDKNRFFARYAIQDEAGRRRVIEQEFALVWDAEAWWFKDEKGHISAQLVFRAGRFRISPPRLASKPRRPAPQEPAQA